MAQYLVTGGCGFIGSHLTHSLIAQGHRVVILDNLSTGKKENAPPHAKLVIGDVTDYGAIERVWEGIDGCFHLAAVASVEKSITEWVKTHRINSSATVNIFQVASRYPKKVPVIYASSAAVYGNNPAAPLAENAETIPLTAYGTDKLSCELHARIAWLLHRVPTIGLRPFNVYGPRQDPYSPYSGVISIFTHRITEGLPVTIYGSGEQVRDFIYVDDAVRTFIASMGSAKEGYDVINICTGNATSINSLVDNIDNLLGRKSMRRYMPPRRGDIHISIGNPHKLRAKLRLAMDTSLQQGLSRMMCVAS